MKLDKTLDDFLKFEEKRHDWLIYRYEIARRSLLAWRQKGGYPAETYWQTASGKKEKAFRELTGFDPENYSIDLNKTLKELQAATAQEAKEKSGRKSLLAISHIRLTLGYKHISHSMGNNGKLELTVDFSLVKSLPALKNEINQILTSYFEFKQKKDEGKRLKQFDYDKMFQVADLKEQKSLEYKEIGNIVFENPSDKTGEYEESREKQAGRCYREYLKLLNGDWIQDINFP
jgi:hypothetical protein